MTPYDHRHPLANQSPIAGSPRDGSAVRPAEILEQTQMLQTVLDVQDNLIATLSDKLKEVLLEPGYAVEVDSGPATSPVPPMGSPLGATLQSYVFQVQATSSRVQALLLRIQL